MSTPTPDKWQKRTEITKEEVFLGLSELFGIPIEDIKSWAIVIHVHNDTLHASYTASSFDNPENIRSLLEQGLMSL